MRRTRKVWGVGMVVALAVIGAACSDDNSTTSTGASGSQPAAGGSTCPTGSVTDPGGSIKISGSSTVAPITTRAADCFNEAGTKTQITVDGPGTGDGFKLFCAGELDIADASRKIKPEEAQVCTDKGIKFIEIKIAFDGLTVMTSPNNRAVTCLSFPDLYALMGPESQGKADWKDAQALASELGSKTALPDLKLDITAPGEESGTYDSFVEIALEPIAKKRTEAGKIQKTQEKTTRPDYSSQANDDAIIQGIEGPDGSFGWVGFAFADQAGSKVKKLEVSKEAGDKAKCVAPSATTIADGSYPLSRSLYIYVDAAKAKSNTAIAPFVDYYLANASSIVKDADYIPLPSGQIAKSKSRWDALTEGTES